LSTQSKAKELLSEIDAQISGIERPPKGLQAQRKEAAKNQIAQNFHRYARGRCKGAGLSC